jgi:hypothetical protein
MRALTIVSIILGLGALPASAAPKNPTCIDAKDIKDEFIAKGRWIVVTRGQYHFLSGVYAMHPQTPPGLPYGDGAVLATLNGREGGMIFFTDHGRLCLPMPAPAILIKEMMEVVTGPLGADGEEM